MSSSRIISSLGRCMSLLALIFMCVLPIFTSGVSEIQYIGRKLLIEGDALQIQCVATLFEPIQWQKDGKNLINGSNSYFWHNLNENNVIKSFLTVSHVDIHHSGSYQCTPVHHESHHIYVVSANTITGNFEPEGITPHGGYKIIHPHKTLELKCTVNKSGYSFIWKKDAEEIKDGIESKKENDESFVSILTILKPNDDNTGNYECIAKLNNTETEIKTTFYVVSLPTASMDNDVIVVEGEKLTLDCHPTGVPVPTISWVLENMTLNSSTERIKLLPGKNNVTNAILQIADVKLSDRGDYKCVLSNLATTLSGKEIEDTSKVRVKDKLAALWPFLGICAEVFVLCAIIFIYEKKRNKAELDESDTDNSPEQKNTPDHGKDSVRQRK